MEFAKLNNGVQMPMHGIGTFLIRQMLIATKKQ